MPKKIVSETRLYPVIIHQEEGVWGYFSPEFGGGGAATQEDALRLAKDMLESAVADLFEAGEDVPLPSAIAELDADGGQIVSLPVTISNEAERIAITLPKSLIARIDAATNNRSAFFAELARQRLAQ